MFISVIIPALNEDALIVRSIQSARDAGADEIIVCDGGSSDETRALSESLGCKVLQSPPGRGQQMAFAAKAAQGQVLVFLHADSELAEDCLAQIREQLNGALDSGADDIDENGAHLAWGCFEHSIAAAGAKYRWLERGNLWRARRQKMVYGDQVQWMTRAAYDRAGGYQSIAIMEDVQMSKALRRFSDPVILPGPVTISPRHWERKGVVRSTVRNWFLFTLHRFGIPEDRIKRMYR